MDNSWVLFSLDKEEYGIRTEQIRQMVLLTDPSEVPDHPDYMRGVINLRSMVIPVLDLRKRLGRKSLPEVTDELIDILSKGEQEHVDWLNELQSSVEENREFTLNTDPRRCVFGQWYDNFTTENAQLVSQLKKFDELHKAVHEIADTVRDYLLDGKADDARFFIHYARENEMANFRKIFKKTRAMIKENNREIVVIVEWDNSKIGLIVDAVLDVTDIPQTDIEPSPKIRYGRASRYILGLAKKGDQVKILLDVDSLMAGEELISAR